MSIGDIPLEYLKQIFASAPYRTELAQIKSKALLEEVSKGDTKIRWNYISSRIIRNIIAASSEIVDYINNHPESLNEFRIYLHQFAKIWESLGKLEEDISKKTAFYNAALTYELAGYQANSFCLVKSISRKYYDIDEVNLLDLVGFFLQRLILQLKFYSEIGQIEPDFEKLSLDDMFDAIALGLVSKSLYNISLYIMSGNDEYYSIGKDILLKSVNLYDNIGAPLEANLIRGIYNLLPIIKNKSIWTNLKNIVTNNDGRWERYLKLLVRGIGSDIWESASISELWPSQLIALEKNLLSPSSKMIRMPTSAGKTRIAEIAMAHVLVTVPNAKCIYVAPYKALVWEIEENLQNIFNDLGYSVSSITGSYESDVFENFILNQTDILVLTPEKLDLILRADPDFLKNVKIFVFDEGQIIHEGRRGIKYEFLLSRIKRILENAKFFFISAVVPKNTLIEFSNWLNANPQRDILETEWRPATQRIAYFRWRGKSGEIRYWPVPGEELITEFVPGIIRENRYRFPDEKKNKVITKKFPTVGHKAQTSVELAIKYCNLGPVLIFCMQKPWVESVAKAFKKRIEYAKYNNSELPLSLKEDTSKPSYVIAKEWLGETHYLTYILKHGIAIHTGDIPDILRKSIETDLRKGVVKVIICTTTLAQGVNFPIRTVIIHSCKRYDEEKGSIMLSARDYWNIAGRAGRAGKETEGTIIHIGKTTNDLRDFIYYVSRKNDVEPIQSSLYQLLVDLLENRINRELIEEALNPEVLALLVEESVESFTDELMDEIFDGTLVNIQAINNNKDISILKKVVIEVGNNIKEDLPDIKFWKSYSSTGLSSKSCKDIQKYLIDNSEYIKNLIINANEGNRDETINMFIESFSTVEEMQSNKEFLGSYAELLNYWISGESIENIIKYFKEQSLSVEELVNFIEDLFGYRYPWGISAFIKISSDVLEIEEHEISGYIQFLPSMVKFGVPNPASGWGMSIGIPTRDVAIKLASHYYISTTEDPSYMNYIEYIGSIDTDYLVREFDLKSPILEDVTKILTKMGKNDLLVEHVSIKEILPYTTEIRGISRIKNRMVAMNAELDMEVEIEREYHNLIDRNAILVKLNGEELGYLNWRLAQLAAVDMDCGLKLSGKITSIENGDIPKIHIEIYIKK